MLIGLVGGLGLAIGMFAASQTALDAQGPHLRLPPGRYNHNYQAGDILSPSRYIGDDGAFGFLGRILVVEDALVLGDFQPLRDGNQILVYDRRTGELKYETGRRGQGPSDVLSLGGMSLLRGEPQQFVVADGANARLLVFDIADWTGSPVRTIANRDAPLIFEVEWLRGDAVAANSANFRDELLRFYAVGVGDKLEIVRSAGAPWFPGEEPLVSARLSTTWMAANPSGDKIVLASRWANRLEVYSATGERIRTLAGPEEVIPEYVVENGWRVRRDVAGGYRAAYADVAAGNDYIFALFSGRGGDDAGLADELHVFTWDGEVAAVLGLEEPIAFLDIDKTGRTLYGIRPEPYPLIVEYEVPAIRTKRNAASRAK